MAKKWPEIVVKWALVIVIHLDSEYIYKNLEILKGPCRFGIFKKNIYLEDLFQISSKSEGKKLPAVLKFTRIVKVKKRSSDIFKLLFF